VAVRLASLVLVVTVCGCGAAVVAKTDRGSSLRDYVKAYAFSSCICDAFPEDETTKREAAAAARGYFELGDFPVEAQAELIALGRKFLSKPYRSHLGEERLTLMKCIDLYHSSELDELSKKYSAQSR
jgi:hypothetical protein